MQDLANIESILQGIESRAARDTAAIDVATQRRSNSDDERIAKFEVENPFGELIGGARVNKYTEIGS